MALSAEEMRKQINGYSGKKYENDFNPDDKPSKQFEPGEHSSLSPYQSAEQIRASINNYHGVKK